MANGWVCTVPLSFLSNLLRSLLEHVLTWHHIWSESRQFERGVSHPDYTHSMHRMNAPPDPSRSRCEACEAGQGAFDRQSARINKTSKTAFTASDEKHTTSLSWPVNLNVTRFSPPPSQFATIVPDHAETIIVSLLPFVQVARIEWCSSRYLLWIWGNAERAGTETRRLMLVPCLLIVDPARPARGRRVRVWHFGWHLGDYVTGSATSWNTSNSSSLVRLGRGHHRPPCSASKA